jgi:hypothetical protein
MGQKNLTFGEVMTVDAMGASNTYELVISGIRPKRSNRSLPILQSLFLEQPI